MSSLIDQAHLTPAEKINRRGVSILLPSTLHCHYSPLGRSSCISIMPGPGATDPADMMAQGRRDLGLTQQLEQQRRVGPNPSNGGSTGYPVWFRLQQLQNNQNNENVKVSASSIYRWNQRITPHCQTGSRDQSQLIGFEMINMVCFIIAHPDATCEEITMKEGIFTTIQQFPND